MIDIHTHILPALCDGSQDLGTSLEMARIAVADGTTHLACTPHIYPPLYQNHKAGITATRDALQTELDKQNIPLHLIIGADVHMMPEVMQGLKRGTIPTLNGSRYFLLEPSHHVPVLDFLGQIENFLNAGYVPVITHPERLHWFGDKYAEFIEAARMGAWLQITAGAITGVFGQVAKQHAERLLREGYVHIIASDAHGIQQRPPILSAGVQAAATLLGDSEEAMRMVTERPQAILDNLPPDSITPPAALRQMANNNLSAEALTHINKQGKKSWLGRLFG
ncbi:MAG: capsular biosynthesis protein [Thiothrix sp.]|uniref:tyrosine-protein phosphatase n=1 Tax=Thiothrix sp. TaxID=1032 RepID=UPI002611992B|nr:CpsB/CapC family capsule biosynthesis tyrosine phosphatase [Thiothrix sp.]MDD5392933.1 capsular biosynthesis protein [Thiothrix sp.]